MLFIRLKNYPCIVACVGAGQQVRRKEMFITAGPEVAQSFLSSGKEGKSSAPI